MGQSTPRSLLAVLLYLAALPCALPLPQIKPFLDPVITAHGDTVALTNLAQPDTEDPSASTSPIANAGPSSTASQPKSDTVVYWGLSPDQRPLHAYCDAAQGISTIVLAFLTSWGSDSTSGEAHPTGKIGSCEIGASQATCTDLQSDIDYCKSQGVKIFISLGGANIASGLTSQWDAETTAMSLWNSWAAPNVLLSNVTAPRPIGDSFVDGFDFDIETNADNNAALLPHLVNYLRGLFARDTVNSYLISGAPQCPLPEINMGTAIEEAAFDLLYVQFYNNPLCSAFQATGRNDGGSFNWPAWQEFISSTASKDAKMYLGLPSSSLGANGGDQGPGYFLHPSELKDVVLQVASAPNFGGVMLWDAYYSDQATENDCTYVQNVRRVLDKGVIC